MKINRKTNVKLEFTESNYSFFLANAIFQYICEMDNNLEDNIGFDENENTQNNDFLYCYCDDDLEMKSKIEKYIVEFENKFNLIEDFLVESSEISDRYEFYEQFTKLSKIVKLNSKLDKSLDNKTKLNNKRKI